ncbi:hypothetical protein LINPERHAP1_LOCUS31520 [Linum perenne]
MKDLGKKWREDRQTLWDKLCDPTEQKEQNYKRNPNKVDAAKWQTFVDHRMSKYTKETVERFMEDPATHNHISSFDAVGRAFNEKEHSGHVHDLGFEPTPSQKRPLLAPIYDFVSL